MSLPIYLPEAVAVSEQEFRKFGCPNCGCLLHHTMFDTKSSKLCECADCSYVFVVLSDASVQISSIGLGRSTRVFYPVLVKHPRCGLAASKYLASRLADGDQFFRVRGLWFDVSPGCFACQRAPGMHKNIIGFALSLETAMYILQMFKTGVSLTEKDGNAQIKIGACGDHLPNLEKLYHELKQAGTPVINRRMIARSVPRAEQLD